MSSVAISYQRGGTDPTGRLLVMDINGTLTLQASQSAYWFVLNDDDKTWQKIYVPTNVPNAHLSLVNPVDGKSTELTIAGEHIGQVKIAATTAGTPGVNDGTIVGIGGIIIRGTDGNYYCTNPGDWKQIPETQLPAGFRSDDFKKYVVSAYLPPTAPELKDTTLVTCYLLNLGVTRPS